MADQKQVAEARADAERLQQELRAIAGESYIADGTEPNVLSEAADLLARLSSALGQVEEALRVTEQHIRDVIERQPFKDDSGWKVYAEPLLQQVLRDIAALQGIPPPQAEKP